MQTHTYTYTRTSVLVDQVDLFLSLSGIGAESRAKVVNAVNEKWIEAVAVYVEKNGKRVLEGELKIDWNLHSDHADLTIATDSPGWAGGAAPELTILASRLMTYATSEAQSTRFWVIFTKAIREDTVLYKARCEKVGVGGTVSDWNKDPVSKRIVLQDMTEAHVTLSDAR
jgi:hypothetical protein